MTLFFLILREIVSVGHLSSRKCPVSLYLPNYGIFENFVSYGAYRSHDAIVSQDVIVTHVRDSKYYSVVVK